LITNDIKNTAWAIENQVFLRYFKQKKVGTFVAVNVFRKNLYFFKFFLKFSNIFCVFYVSSVNKHQQTNRSILNNTAHEESRQTFVCGISGWSSRLCLQKNQKNSRLSLAKVEVL
jgi:hypothetical protein